MHALKRILKYGWLNFWRNLWVSTATVGIMVLALAMVSSLLVAREVGNTFVRSLEQKMDISVYFVLDADESDILKVKNVLEDRPEVREVRYISRNEALDIFRARHQDNDILVESLQELGTNPLQATLNVKAIQASQFGAITSFIEHASFKEIIEKVNYRENEKVIDKLISISSGIEQVGLVLAILLGSFVILVTFNTIRLAIYSAREEISIMRLVGAGNWYIRGPFVVAGILYGIIAAAITFGLLSAIVWFFTPHISAVFTEINLLEYYRTNITLLAGILFGTAIALGAVSSFFATQRYLKI
jgi:cell division transport system permease protein